jgi:hypothetical protein
VHPALYHTPVIGDFEQVVAELLAVVRAMIGEPPVIH